MIKDPRVLLTLVGMGTGGISGALEGRIFATKKYKERRNNYALKGALAGALLGGVIGFDSGRRRIANAQFWKNFKRNAGARFWEEDPDWARDFFNHGFGTNRTNSPTFGTVGKQFDSILKKQTKKADAVKIFKTHVMKHHPDKDGDIKNMQDINSVWNDFKKYHFDKLAYFTNKIKTFYRM
jgi:hypothetical protein